MSTNNDLPKEKQLREKPLSPHLQIYAPQLTSITSILHRVSGIGNTVGLVLLSLILWGAANDSGLYFLITDFMTTPFGLVVLSGFAASFSYHLSTGIRHFIFDAGAMMDLKNSYRLGYATLALALILSVLIIAKIWMTLG